MYIASSEEFPWIFVLLSGAQDCKTKPWDNPGKSRGLISMKSRLRSLTTAAICLSASAQTMVMLLYPLPHQPVHSQPPISRFVDCSLCCGPESELLKHLHPRQNLAGDIVMHLLQELPCSR